MFSLCLSHLLPSSHLSSLTTPALEWLKPLSYNNSAWAQCFSSAKVPYSLFTMLEHFENEAPNINNRSFERKRLSLVPSFILPHGSIVPFMDAVWVSQVPVWPLALHPGKCPNSQADYVPMKPSVNSPHRDWTPNNSLGGKSDKQRVYCYSGKRSEWDWPEPTVIIALINQHTVKGTGIGSVRLWLKSHRPTGVRKRREAACSCIRIQLHTGPLHFFKALIGFCWGRDKCFMFLSLCVSASLCFSISQSFSQSPPHTALLS